MIFISHRGNLEGAVKERENFPGQIDLALSLDFDVEIDLWLSDGSLKLGHDFPENRIDESFLLERSSRLWVHAKNLECISFLNQSGLNWFWHENDKLTMTSKSIPWAFPEVFVSGGVVNQPSDTSTFWSEKLYEKTNFCGICHDNIVMVKKTFDRKIKGEF